MSVRGLSRFIYFICVCHLNDAVFFNDAVLTTPQPYLFIGENLTLTCNLTSPKISENASVMYFRRKNAEILPKKYVQTLGPKSIRLWMPVTSAADEGNYVCWLNGTETQNSILGNQLIKVDYKPAPVQNISCVVHNWSTMNCSWDLQQNYIHQEDFDVTLIWTISTQFGDHSAPQKECKDIHLTYCVWSREEFMANFVYYMAVIVKNTRRNVEAHSKKIKIDTLMIVKPASVTGLRVVKQDNTCLHLTWDHSTFHNKVFKVEYRSLELWGTHTWQPHPDGLQPKMETILCGLIPFTTYEVRVSVMPQVLYQRQFVVRGFLSDWESTVNKTSEAVPVAAPSFSCGSYTEQSCQERPECRLVIIYWQPIKQEEWRGRPNGYQLELHNLNSRAMEVQILPQSALNANLTLDRNTSYKVQIFARSSMGMSKEFSSITIPKYSTKPQGPQEFVVETDVNTHGSPRFSLTWKDSRNNHHPTGYTLYWCFGDKVTLRCLEQIQWQHLKPNQHTYELHIPSGQNGLSNYLIGISADKCLPESVNVSSGIQWKKCIFTKGLKPEKPPKNVNLPDHQADRSLRVEWEHYDCSAVQSFVTAYLIQYCVVTVRNTCAEPLVNVTVKNDQVSYLIDHLQPQASYGVVMRLMSRSGVGPASSMMVKRVEDNHLKTGDIVGISFAGLFMLIVTMFSTCILIRKLRALKKKLILKAQFPQSLMERQKDNTASGGQGTPLLPFKSPNEPTDTPIDDTSHNITAYIPVTISTDIPIDTPPDTFHGIPADTLKETPVLTSPHAFNDTPLETVPEGSASASPETPCNHPPFSNPGPQGDASRLNTADSPQSNVQVPNEIHMEIIGSSLTNNMGENDPSSSDRNSDYKTQGDLRNREGYSRVDVKCKPSSESEDLFPLDGPLQEESSADLKCFGRTS